MNPFNNQQLLLKLKLYYLTLKVLHYKNQNFFLAVHWQQKLLQHYYLIRHMKIIFNQFYN